MATMQRRLVHKQFNSPINLYSQRNIQETLDRELKQLSNGAIGIDFDDPSTTKPPSLAKSAVLQALEEEERQQQSRGKGLKRVAWPPSAEGGDEYEQVQQQQPQQQQPQQQQYYQQPQQQQAPAFQQYQQPAQQQQQPRERIIPIQRPEQQNQPQYQPQPTQAFQPLVSQQQQQQQFYQPEPQQQQQQLHQHQPEPVPFFTTLRSEPPMSQEPAPVYQTQPVAAIYQGGSNMRGDQKWPPAEIKKQSELENEERRRLAQEPAFRPRKVQKDYANFFAKNALNQTYPGYRAPPGTQHHN